MQTGSPHVITVAPINPRGDIIGAPSGPIGDSIGCGSSCGSRGSCAGERTGHLSFSCDWWVEEFIYEMNHIPVIPKEGVWCKTRTYCLLELCSCQYTNIIPNKTNFTHFTLKLVHLLFTYQKVGKIYLSIFILPPETTCLQRLQFLMQEVFFYLY